VEPYLSTQSGSAYFFGGLSFLLHSSNTTRLTCANFVQVNGSSMAPNSTAPGTPQFTGAAGKVAAGVGAFGAAVVAALL
jgi:hypothetical protein